MKIALPGKVFHGRNVTAAADGNRIYVFSKKVNAVIAILQVTNGDAKAVAAVISR
jgi:hypothetical protein